MNQIKKVIILGIGGISIDILDVINDINCEDNEEEFECIGFLDDKESNIGKMINNIKVLGSLNLAKNFEDSFFINGIGNSFNFFSKEVVLKKTNLPLDKFITLIHPTANISKTAKIGFGTVIFQNVTIASNVKIGNHVAVLPGSVVSHNDIIGEYSIIASGVCISGGVNIGKSCYLGTNCSLKENISMGDYSLVGMGSVVLSNISTNSIFVGSPAKFLRKTI